MVEWTVRELAARAGISPRTLRHYHQIGLLTPDRIGSNGYRYYGPTAVARLQRILLLREAGMSLPAIADALAEEDDQASEVGALEAQLAQLHWDHDALARRITAVEHALEMRRAGRQPRMDMMLEGFNDRYEDEVTRRWGRDVFEQSNAWWHAKSIDQQRQFQADAEELLAVWGRLQQAGGDPSDTTAQEHAARHAAWFAQVPGTPAHSGDAVNTQDMLHGMADAYLNNPDFHRAFGGAEAAKYASRALHHYAARQHPE
ncbi:MerR family transcriptional regulator [Brachybacterium phenoliresistens]|uniref:MerR family transcriptional regulator n=1 Tax=Brachybacterium phenoliresistens TaxID=396014 RepID=UPI0031D75BB1